MILQPGVPFPDDVRPQVSLFHFQRPKSSEPRMRLWWSRWSGGRRSLTHPLARPFGRDGHRSICCGQKERRRNRCSRPMSPLVDCNEGIRQPPRLAPQDQYAEGILSLSEKRAELVPVLWRNSNESNASGRIPTFAPDCCEHFANVGIIGPPARL